MVLCNIVGNLALFVPLGALLWLLTRRLVLTMALPPRRWNTDRVPPRARCTKAAWLTALASALRPYRC